MDPKVIGAVLTLFVGTSIHAQQEWDWVEPATDIVPVDIATDPAGNTYAIYQYQNPVTFGGVPWEGQSGALALHDPDGVLVWVRPIHGASFAKLALHGDTLYAAGYGTDVTINIGDYSWSWSPPSTDARTLLLSAFTLDGTMAWMQVDTLLITGQTSVGDIEINADNEILVAWRISGHLSWNGETVVITGSPVLQKRGPGGGKLWYARGNVFNGSGSMNGVAALPDGGAVVTGSWCCSALVFDTIVVTDPYFFVARVDADGHFLWAKDGNLALGVDVDPTLDDSVYIAGSFGHDGALETSDVFSPFQISTFGIEQFLVKMGLDGGYAWVHTSQVLYSETWTQLKGMCVDADGNALVSGDLYGDVTFGAVIGGDTIIGGALYLEKVSPGGNTVWTTHLAFTPSPLLSQQFLQTYGVGVDAEGRGYLGGIFRSGDLTYDDNTIASALETQYIGLVGRTDLLSTSVISRDRSRLSLFPNPTTGLLHITDLSPTARVSFTDLRGRPVQPIRVASDRFDLGAMSDGIYMIHVTDGDRRTTERLMLVR